MLHLPLKRTSRTTWLARAILVFCIEFPCTHKDESWRKNKLLLSAINEGEMMKTVGVIYTTFMLFLAVLLFMSMESSTYQMLPDLRIIAKAVYYVGIVVAIGMAGLPWTFTKVNTEQ